MSHLSWHSPPVSLGNHFHPMHCHVLVISLDCPLLRCVGLISFKRITICQKFSDVKHRNCHHASLSLWLALKHLASFWSFECKFDLRGKKASIEMHAIGAPVHRRRLHGLEALSWMENTFPGASVFHPPDPLDKVFHHFVYYTTTTTNVYILPKDFILSIWEIWFVWYPMVWLAGCLEALTMSELASWYSSDDPVIWLFDDLVIIHDHDESWNKSFMIHCWWLLMEANSPRDTRPGTGEPPNCSPQSKPFQNH